MNADFHPEIADGGKRRQWKEWCTGRSGPASSLTTGRQRRQAKQGRSKRAAGLHTELTAPGTGVAYERKLQAFLSLPAYHRLPCVGYFEYAGEMFATRGNIHFKLKMRILYLSPRQAWPPVSGAGLRDYYFARALARYAQLTYIYFSETGGSEGLAFCEEVIGIPRPKGYTPGKIIRGLFGRWPLPVVNYTSEA